MITNTCLIGGSLEGAPAGEEPPGEEPAASCSPPVAAAGAREAAGGAFAPAVDAPLAGAGVGVASASGGSLAADDGEPPPLGDAGAVRVGGSTTRRRPADAASVPLTCGPAASPMSAPKPRKAITSSTE